MALAAEQTARLLNVADLAGPFELSRPTIRHYVTLRERVVLTEELSPWHSNRISRLAQRPKLHMRDTGLASTLLGLDASPLDEDRETYGQSLETFVLGERRRLASGFVVGGTSAGFEDNLYAVPIRALWETSV